MSDYEFILPLVVYIPRKRVADVKFPVNINHYRNAHHNTNNDAKIAYKEHMRFQLTGLIPITGKIHVSYEYYAAMNNKPDLDNFVSAAKKFFQDAMVSCGLIEDDNVHFISSNSEKYMGIDRKNPRIVAKITVLD